MKPKSFLISKHCLAGLLALLLSSCEGTSDPNAPLENLQPGAFCYLMVNSNYGLCIDYSTNSPANSSACGTTEVSQYQNIGVTVGNYYTLLGFETSCSYNNAVQFDISGYCTVSFGTILYYSTYWTASNAQIDCTSQSGTWVAN